MLKLLLRHRLTYIYNSDSLKFAMRINEAGYFFHKWLLDASSRKLYLSLIRPVRLKLINLL